jgi:hypothetical protein
MIASPFPVMMGVVFKAVALSFRECFGHSTATRSRSRRVTGRSNDGLDKRLTDLKADRDHIRMGILALERLAQLRVGLDPAHVSLEWLLVHGVLLPSAAAGFRQPAGEAARRCHRDALRDGLDLAATLSSWHWLKFL